MSGNAKRSAGSAVRGPSGLRAVLRVTAAIFAAYGFAWGLASVIARLGVMAGMVATEAATLGNLLALLVLPGVVLWCFAVRRATMGWLVLGGGGALLTGLAWGPGAGMP